MTPIPAIVAPDAVVHRWKEAAAHAMHAANRADDSVIVAGLGESPCEVGELVTYLVETLLNTAGVFLASVANATPGAPEAIDAGLKELVAQVVAEQNADRGRETDGVCPIPDPKGVPYRCACGPTSRTGCAQVAYDIGAGRLRVDAVDDGCEGGVA